MSNSSAEPCKQSLSVIQLFLYFWLFRSDILGDTYKRWKEKGQKLSAQSEYKIAPYCPYHLSS